MDRMNASAQRMQQLIEDLLKYSRVSHIRYNKSLILDLNVELTELIHSNVSFQEIKNNIHIEKLPSINGWEPVHLQQLFTNLISNSIKFQRKDTTLQIDIRLEKENKKSFVVAYQDNGIGFEQQFATQILKPFQRLHGRSEYEGTGIGLAICQKLMERHKGNIKAKSKPNKGATFLLLFKK